MLQHGPRITEHDQPELFALIRDVAARTKQTMPEEVYLLNDVNAFVSAIVQSEQLGASISRVLTSQSVQMRRLGYSKRARMSSAPMVEPMAPSPSTTFANSVVARGWL